MLAFYLALLPILLGSTANAEVLHLKDGSKIHGTIKLANAELVEIETPNGLLSVKKERITSIDYSAEVTESSMPRPSAPPPIQNPSEPLRPSGKGRIFTSLDYYLPANAGDGFKNDAQATAAAIAGMGYNVAGSVKTSGGIGGRLGFLVPISEIVELGVSGGFIVGPNSEAKLTLTSAGNNGVATVNRSVSFLRFLIEERTKFPLSEKSSFRLGGGIGAAHGKVKDELICTGSACTRPGVPESDSATWSGFAWEITAELMFQNISFGSRFAGFPKFDNSKLSKMEWTTPGLFFGYTF